MTPPQIANTRYATVAVSELVEHPRNPRKGNVEVIEESLGANGFFGTIVVQESTGHVIVGNHRLKAARAAGMTEVPVAYVDVDDQAALRIMLADNRTAELATNDDELLLSLLRELDAGEGLTGTGYTDDDGEALERLLAVDGPSSAPLPVDEAWKGMPDYENADLTAAFQTIVHFQTEEDRVAFFDLIGQKLTPRSARSVWYPQTDGHVGCEMTDKWVAPDAETAPETPA